MDQEAAVARPGSLSQKAYESFKEALFERRIAPGAFMSQAELVEVVGVPLGPLREALQVLQAEGLLTIHARSGIEIAKPDFGLVRNTYQLRQILERPAIRHFSETAPLDRLDEIEAQHRWMLEGLQGKEITRELARDVETVDFGFHLAVIESLKNPLLTKAYIQTVDYIRLIRLDHHYSFSTAMVVRTMHEHLDIIGACRARDPDAAEKALADHFGRAMQRAMGL